MEPMTVNERETAIGQPRRRRTAPRPSDVDVVALKRDLREHVGGEVRFDAGSRGLYANDFSIYRHVPIGVVIPRDADDVVAAVAACRRHGAPILPRGCGTGPAGQSVNVAVVFDYSKLMTGILELDAEGQRARVQPGVICDQLRDAAEAHHLTYAPDPATHEYCTFGGMLGNNSCGTHSIMGGKTVDNVIELDVVTYDGLRVRVGATSDEELERIVAEGGQRGEIYAGLRDLRDRYADLIRARYPDIPRRVSGYNLDELLPERGFNVARALVGSEGTCVSILEATVRLVPSPPHRATVVLTYGDLFSAADHVPEIMSHGPIGLEGFDDLLLENMDAKGRLATERSLLPPGKAWLYAEFGAWSQEEAVERAQAAREALERGGGATHAELRVDPGEQVKVWAVRESAVGDSRLPHVFDAEGAWEDAAVHPDRLGAYLRDFDALIGRHGYRCVYYGHFGQGCVHTRIDFDFKTAGGVREFRSFMEEAADLVVSHGGSIAGEYGEGQGRAELLPRMFGPELVAAFGEFKAIWDPDRKMNPHKIVDPYPLDEDLRYGPEHRPPELRTHFTYPDDRGSFALAIERCFGMSKCRSLGGRTMCPSYQVTREERHTTRGRARLLLEMLKGETLTNGWRDEGVKEALDLCLSCKGCKGDCPTQVDMATYKAEFLAHYYARRLRPRQAYALGLMPWWARLAEPAPWLANLVARGPVLAGVAKKAAGVAPERDLPEFAREPLTRWFARRKGAAPRDGAPVLLWPDTFSNYLAPQPAKAAIEVLEAAGRRVELPRARLCCGRPLYDFGMLRLAKRTLRRVLDELAPQIEDGIPMVGVEPACVAVFRDEMLNLFPADEHARRLARQTFTLAEFLEREGFEPPRLERRALVHRHCHAQAIMGFEPDLALIKRLGLHLDQPDPGCCGMAGSFGYEQGERYELSVKVGERVLAPAVRAATDETLIVADGFSCRQQIEALTGRSPMHLAEVVRLALRQGHH
jgi:FAD/FMN-containing dehydrogenase/Fe-S oxidoreductase